MSEWADFYKKRMNRRYSISFRMKYRPFIYELLEVVGTREDCKHIAEFGCGIGTVTKAIDLFNPTLHHALIDNDPAILSLADKNLTGTTCRALLIEWDIRERIEIKADLIHSHGVLEHFSDDDIKKIIKNQMALTKTLRHYVPSHKYEKKTFGDERLMMKEEWKEICEPEDILEFNDGYDLILRWG